MGFVCVMKSEKGIVACSDTKKTIIDATMAQDEKHDALKEDGEIQKIFKGENYIIATCGNRTEINNKTKRTSPNKTYAELISKLIFKFPKDYRMLCHALFEKKDDMVGSHKINLFIGAKCVIDDKPVYITEICNIDEYSYRFSEYSYYPTMMWDGIYSDILLIEPMSIRDDAEIEDMVDGGKKVIAAANALAKISQEYNSIGDNVIVETLT